jgi:hypothetical protein
MRALTSAVFFFFLNFLGLGFGPLTVGAISDWLRPSLGVASLRWALSVLLVVGIASAWLFSVTAGKLVKETTPLHYRQ